MTSEAGCGMRENLRGIPPGVFPQPASRIIRGRGTTAPWT